MAAATPQPSDVNLAGIGIPESDPEMRELAQVLRRLHDGGIRLPMLQSLPVAPAGPANPPLPRDELVSLLSDIKLGAGSSTDDRNLPIEIQALVSRLQLPILRVALKDRSFFTDRKHPARQLINEIARTSIGWESSDRDEQDALFIRLTELVEQVLDLAARAWSEAAAVDNPQLERRFSTMLARLAQWWDAFAAARSPTG